MGAKEGPGTKLKIKKKQGRKQAHGLGIRDSKREQRGQKLTNPSSTTNTAKTKDPGRNLEGKLGKAYCRLRCTEIGLSCSNAQTLEFGFGEVVEMVAQSSGVR